MMREGLSASGRYSKCAGVVGEVLKKYHPHGDSAVYDALVRMAQPWSMRHTLIDGQGNFGSPDGHAAAAYRYTECRLTPVAETMLTDIEKETVDFSENFDGTSLEPTVLPTRFPALLVNGSEGIAVGMATRIPPHNLGETIDAILHLLANPTATARDLARIIPAPDFPTGAFILGREGAIAAYETGHGRVVIRSKCEIEDKEKGKPRIIVTELPYQVSGDRLVERIAELVKEKEIDGISDVNNESGRKGRRIVIELKRDAVPEVVLNQLYKLTPMQTSFSMLMLALVGGRPKVLTLREILENFVNHRREVVTRRTQYELRKAKEREHILEGLKIAVDHIDEVIAIIRASQTTSEARGRLMDRFALSERQSQAILDMRLAKLTGLERDGIERELGEVRTEIARLWGILSDETLLVAEIRNELLAVKERFATPRKTQILSETGELTVEDLVADGEMVVTLTHEGYIKRMPLSLFRAQSRGGKGRTGSQTRDGDFMTDAYVATTHTSLLVFTNHGQVHTLKVYDVPSVGPQARGKPIINLLNIDKDEKVRAVVPIDNFDTEQLVVFATREGFIKKTALADYRNINARGIIALNLREGDDVVNVALAKAGEEIMMASKKGMAVRFSEATVPQQGRVASGVIGMRLDEGDAVVAMELARPSLDVLTICENGFGKRTPVEEYRQTNRGAKGVINIVTSERNGDVVGFVTVDDTHDLILVTDAGQLIRTKARQVRVTGRAAQGVTIMKLDAGTKVASVTRVEPGDDDEAEGERPATGEGAALVDDAGVTVPEAPGEVAALPEPSSEAGSPEDIQRLLDRAEGRDAPDEG